jgi:hypothetical protein
MGEYSDGNGHQASQVGFRIRHWEQVRLKVMIRSVNYQSINCFVLVSLF